MEICAMSLDLPVVEGHPNRIPFHGVLTYADTESDKSPSGARGHCIVLTRAAVIQALPSLLGMSVDFKTGWDGHDYRQKCGVITAAELVGSELRVGGFIFKKDFPEVETKSKSHELGMSYELENAHVEDMRQMVWTVTKFTFNGAAILLKDKAAYKATSFTIGESNHKCSYQINTHCSSKKSRLMASIRQFVGSGWGRVKGMVTEMCGSEIRT